MNKKLISSILILFSLFINSIFAQTTEENKTEELKQSLVILESLREHDLNPQTTTYASDAQFLTGLYEGLFSYNPVNLDPVYAIAVDYRISRDKKRWTFKINPNAYFSNGEKITAYSVRDSWMQLLSTPSAPYASLLDVIQGAEAFRNGKGSADSVGIYANSEEELSIHLKEAANYLPRVLCHSAFSVINSNPTVSSGPFYLEDYSDGVYVMKKNPYYWDKDNTHLEEITFIQSDNKDENAWYYNTGVTQWISGSVDTTKIINPKAIQLNAEFATSYFFFKSYKAKPGQQLTVWDFPEFRSALFEAMPWDELRKGSYYPAPTFVYPLNGYPIVEGYTYTDSKEAEVLMKNAREKFEIPQDLTIPLIVELSENSVSENVLQAMKDAFAPLGVEMIVLQKSYASYLKGISNSTADLFCYSWIGDFADPLAFLELFRSTSTLNDAGWENAEFDALLKKAAEVSQEERYKYLAQAEEILLDSYVVIPIHNPVTVNIVNLEEVGGWAANAFDIHPLKYLYRKMVKPNWPNVVLK